ncbi:transmembrane protein, putative [Medicago truncatula]|uniref:Transmembrane protein, putative n=1 Tax=Medicago truncatula TaxID=3880 RepID=G7IQI8_MEDTR|nr:transmembrane protein, putative [Medicago truncatula]
MGVEKAPVGVGRGFRYGMFVLGLFCCFAGLLLTGGGGSLMNAQLSHFNLQVFIRFL